MTDVRKRNVRLLGEDGVSNVGHEDKKKKIGLTDNLTFPSYASVIEPGST